VPFADSIYELELIVHYFSGVVKYLGPLEENLVAPELYVGIHLDKQG